MSKKRNVMANQNSKSIMLIKNKIKQTQTLNSNFKAIKSQNKF